jgi:Ca2+/H+ antiporter, TMEM165/GDT1 family
VQKKEYKFRSRAVVAQLDRVPHYECGGRRFDSCRPHQIFLAQVVCEHFCYHHSMEAFLNSFFLVFAGEMGDKTQLLALVLAARYKKPWTIMLGIFIATVLNHALAAWLGGFVASYIDDKTQYYTLAVIFFAFAAWILVPDKDEDLKEVGRFGVLVTTIVSFFLAEMGDKTQLATVALGASYPQLLQVTLGTTLGMLASNALAIFLGHKLLAKISMKWVRIFACFLFVAFGVALLFKASTL